VTIARKSISVSGWPSSFQGDVRASGSAIAVKVRPVVAALLLASNAFASATPSYADDLTHIVSSIPRSPNRMEATAEEAEAYFYSDRGPGHRFVSVSVDEDGAAVLFSNRASNLRKAIKVITTQPLSARVVADITRFLAGG
jgi:hypothetical protein